MNAIMTMFRVLKIVVLAAVTIIFAYLAWEATKHILVVGDFLSQYLNALDSESRSEIAWMIISALFAPWLGMLLWLLILCHIGDNPSDPAKMRERVAALLREADVIERLRAQRRKDLLRTSRVQLEARRPVDIHKR